MILCIQIFFSPTSLGTVPTRGSPGLRNQTISSRRPGIHGDVTTPGLQTTSSQAGHPGVVSPGVTGYPGLHQTTSPSGIPGLHTSTGENPSVLHQSFRNLRFYIHYFFFFFFWNDFFFSTMVCYNSPWWWASKSALCRGPVCMLVIWLCWLKAGLWWQTGLFRWVRWRTLWWVSSTTSQTAWNITVCIDNNGPF